MPFKAGDLARAKQESWHPDYANHLFLVLERREDDYDIEFSNVMGVTGNKYILLDHIGGGKIHAYDSELEELK